jgi:hypothetical protein
MLAECRVLDGRALEVGEAISTCRRPSRQEAPMGFVRLSTILPASGASG